MADYKGSGYDRGHQAPAGNQTTDPRLKDETFYLSNMAPQKPLFNRQVWKQLEELTRQWAMKRGFAYEITGGFYYDPKEEDHGTATGLMEHRAIGKGRVGVPTHFYKIVTAKDASGAWQAIAFVLENKKYNQPYNFEKLIQSVAWIEERTGLNFMPELSPQERQRLEAKPSAMW